MKPLIIAHRGASGLAPENTFSSFQRALVLGADALECDIHLTQDRQFVVIHDSTINRTSNGKGAVARFTLQQLKQYDFGSWHSAAYAGERILTLKQFLMLCKRAIPVVEVKQKILPASPSLISALRSAKQLHTAIVVSFHYSVLAQLRRQSKKVRLGYLVFRPTSSTISRALSLSCTSINPYYLFCTPSFVRRCHAAGLQVHPWVTDSKFVMRMLIKRGVDGITTNHPETLREVLRGIP
ncbi:hypothetical protein HY491_04460 [Candidatus Woesearchaeota archaeon]|nr:hypothetical protein [Candidatus Woesearchaeota archaeon]